MSEITRAQQGVMVLLAGSAGSVACLRWAHRRQGLGADAVRRRPLRPLLTSLDDTRVLRACRAYNLGG